MIPRLILSAAVLAMLALAGCGGDGSSGSAGPASPPASPAATPVLNQQEDAADQGIGQSGDAATQYLVEQATGTGTTSNAVTNALRQHPDLKRLQTAGPTLVEVSSLVDGNGKPLYPALSGSFTVASTGTAVTSWPTGSNTMSEITVTVTFAPPGLTYTDPVDGATATVSSGTLVFNLLSTFDAGATAGNWTLSIETSTAVAASTPLSWTVTSPGASTRSVTLSGYRHSTWGLASISNPSATPAVDQLLISRSIDGAPLSGTTAPEGVAADATRPAQLFTNWVHTIDGGPAAGGMLTTWNRWATWQLTWNFATWPFTCTLGDVNEEIFITRDGQTIETTSAALDAGDGG